jgi:hypothetical protein
MAESSVPSYLWIVERHDALAEKEVCGGVKCKTIKEVHEVDGLPILRYEGNHFVGMRFECL